MPSDFNLVRYTRPSFKSAVYKTIMTTLETALGFETSDKAKLRLHMLNVFYKSGWTQVHLSFPNLKRPTLYRWKKTFEDSHKSLNSLLPSSTRPKRTRFMATPIGVYLFIKKLRENYPRMGKDKINLFVKEYCLSNNFKQISGSSIGRIIKKNNLFFYGKNKKKKDRNSLKNKLRIRLCPNAKRDNIKPGYIQVDGIKFFLIDKYFYFLTGVDIISRQAWVKQVKTINSKNASIFLKEIITTSFYKVHTIQTDNGSEFKKYFDEAIEELELAHIFSYPRHPKTNGFVERFNYTVKDEFLYNNEDLLFYKEDFEAKLKEWMLYYNEVRPHQSLSYQTPKQYFLNNQLSQM